MSPQQFVGVTCVLADHQGYVVDENEQSERRRHKLHLKIFFSPNAHFFVVLIFAKVSNLSGKSPVGRAQLRKVYSSSVFVTQMQMLPQKSLIKKVKSLIIVQQMSQSVLKICLFHMK